MLEELRKLVKSLPFEPFTLQLSSGRTIHVPHSDHILVTAKGIIAVEDDEGFGGHHLRAAPCRHYCAERELV